jgi:nanoRNase/pAp phosphatase (c-di-AMP/oligoRNAs hydrolase)
VGKLLTNHNGGGHKGAGAFSVEKDKFDEKIKLIINILKKNEVTQD